jgi:hypothetical protein
MITVTNLSPRWVCHHACSSTPITRTAANRAGSSINNCGPAANLDMQMAKGKTSEDACLLRIVIAAEPERVVRPFPSGSCLSEGWL